MSTSLVGKSKNLATGRVSEGQVFDFGLIAFPELLDKRPRYFLTLRFPYPIDENEIESLRSGAGEREE